MKLRKLTAAIVAVALLAGLSALPAGAVQAQAPAAFSGFTDIEDPAAAEAAELLRLLGVVNGTGGGLFDPAGRLTRAEFCKMAVEIRGEGALAEGQMNRTVFLDVKGSHWARGYVNYAAGVVVGGEGAAAERLIAGVGNGCFEPDSAITCAQAVTMAMRLLGYTAAAVPTGKTWYEGYVTSAASIGLTKGLTLTPDAPITRAQAAILFQNLLYTAPNGATGSFLTANLGGTITEEAILLSLDATAPDGTAGAILLAGGKTGDPVYKTDHIPFDRALEGLPVRLLLSKDQKVLSIQPSATVTRRTVTVTEAEATYLTTSDGQRLMIPSATAVYRGSDRLTYAQLYLDLTPGDQLALYYNTSGTLEYLFAPRTQPATTALVVKEAADPAPFDSLVGEDTDYRILKNGASATLSDLRDYDVATYDRESRVLRLSDLRLTGIYENASPSPRTPLTITLLGATFPVLPCATEDLERFAIGERITLLFTADGQVAGAAAPSEAGSTAVGVVTACSTESATVVPLSALKGTDGQTVTFTGGVNYSERGARSMLGSLVTVSSAKAGKLSLSRVPSSAASGALDVKARTLGGERLAGQVYLYERIGGGRPQAIRWSQLTVDAVPADKISYVGLDYAGRASVLILEDVTGDLYEYGFAKRERITQSSESGMVISNQAVFLAGSEARYISAQDIPEGSAVGLAGSLESVGGVAKLGGWVSLTAITGVPRSSFRLEQRSDPTPPEGGGEGDEPSAPVRTVPDGGPIGTVTAGGLTLPIAPDVKCYNAVMGTWFASLDEARAFSPTLTVYYDRHPDQGGKVRLVVVE